jgi:hypothetical protein
MSILMKDMQNLLVCRHVLEQSNYLTWFKCTALRVCFLQGQGSMAQVTSESRMLLLMVREAQIVVKHRKESAQAN